MAVHKDRILKILGVLALLFLIITALLGFTHTLNEQLGSQVLKDLEGVANQSVYTLHTEVENQKNTLQEIAQCIGADPQLASEVLSILKESSKRYPFKRMGVADEDGIAYTTDDKQFNICERDYFQNALKGISSVSQRLEDYTDGEPIIVFSAPIKVEDLNKGVLFAVYEVSEFAQILTTTSYNDDNTFCIIRRNGEVVMDDIHVVEHDSQNIFDRLLKEDHGNQEAVNKLKSAIENGENCTAEIYHQGKRYLQISSLDINDWYLINIVSADVINETKNKIMTVTYFFCFGAGILLVVFVIYMVWAEREKHRELEEILYVDALTGGYSYQKFLKLARKCLNEDNRTAAYIVMDIDQFKLVNEFFGYEKGDDVLKYVFSLWKSWIRPGELFARSGADHFSVLAFYEKQEELRERMEYFVQTIREDSSEKLSGYVLCPNIGIYLIQDHKEDLQSMQNNAVIAFSSVRRENNASYGVYDQVFKQKLLENKLLEDQMEQAYNRQEFILFYQPKFDAFTKKMNGAEALVRWRKEDGTIIGPDRFIPLAEKKGFIVKLDQYIFQKVCEQQKQWKIEGKRLVPISVNLSREHLKEQKFIDEYERIQKECEIPVKYLELELTESAMVENLDITRKVVDELHRRGVRILMDDFGTGYSSLMMLKTIPIDVMKLDKSFVDDYKDPKGEKIIECMISLARNLHFQVTAEGVENEEQYKLLKSLGCDTIQGYYFAKPMPAEEFGKLLEDVDPFT